MQTLKLILIAVVSSASTLVLSAGCEAVRSGESKRVEPAPAAQAPTQAPAAQAPTAQAPAATTTAQAPAAQKPAAPVVQAAPAGGAAQQQPQTTETVVRVYGDVRPSVVTVISSVVQPGFRSEAQPSGTGSGFMIDDRGHILTNNHVVQDANRLDIILSDGTTLPAELVGRDPRFDLAVVRTQIPPDKLRVVRLGDSDQIQVGEQAIAIGNPYGLAGTVTTGIVSARRPAVDEPAQQGQAPGVLINAVQTDAAINPGNSGGPLLNARGEVIGVNTLGRLGQGGGQAGLNFAQPINIAKRVLPDLVQRGSYPHPFVGISSADINQSIAQALNLPVQEGLLVQNVEPNSGAARAGLRGGSGQQSVRSRQIAVGGDIIVAIDGQPIRRPDEFVAYLESNKRAGENVTLTIVRDGQRRDVQVTLGERPQ